MQKDFKQYLPLTGGTLTGGLKLSQDGFETHNDNGFETDQYGNFIHKVANANNYWGICDSDAVNKFRVFFDSGDVTTLGNLQILGNANANGLVFRIPTKTNRGAMIRFADDDTNARFYFYQMKSSDVNYDLFKLPATTLSDTTNKTYDILTTKNLVSKAQGGTGNANGTVDKLTTARSIQIDLASESAKSFDGSASITTGVTGTLQFEHGGTGATSRLAAAKNLTNENVGTAAKHFVTLTDSWGKFGYSSVANAWTALGGGSIGKKNSLAASDITSGTLSLARGGTGGSDSGWVTLSSSNCTGNIFVRRIGEWIQITSEELNMKANLTSASGITLLTLASNYRPGKMLLFTAGCTFDNVYCRITTGGAVGIFKNRQSSSLPTTSTFYISAMYFAA